MLSIGPGTGSRRRPLWEWPAGRRDDPHTAHAGGQSLLYAALPAIVSWLILAGIVAGTFANEAMPPYMVLRPMLVAALLSIVIGLVAHVAFRAHGVVAASLVTLVMALPDAWRDILVVGSVYAVYHVAARFWRPPILATAVARAAAIFALMFATVGTVRAIAVLEPQSPRAIQGEGHFDAPSLYLILVDGYPREDTLRHELGIDTSWFLSGLNDAGFDVYDAANTDRLWTELTLLTLLNGSTNGVPEGPLQGPEKRAVRQQLSEAQLPRQAREAGYDYVVIDAPVGHTTFEAGEHLHHGGLNPFEERLLGRSALGSVVASAWPMMPTDSLRAHLAASLESLVDLADPNAQRLVLAHLLVPHPPFLWDEHEAALPAPSYWPRVQLFESDTQHTHLTRSEFAHGMRGQLGVVNQQILAAVHGIAARDPDGVIVIFSDHGARFSIVDDEAEWYRTFLASRTPGHNRLFEDEPTPTGILRRLLEAYLPA